MSDWRALAKDRLRQVAPRPEVADEILQHLEDRHAELIARGIPAADADRTILTELDDDLLARELAKVERTPVPEPVPGASRGSRLRDLAGDLRYGVRALRKSPAFTIVTILSLALGTGANTAIFQLLDAVHLRPLPVPHADELAIVQIKDRSWAVGSFSSWHSDLTNPLWEEIRTQQQAFTGMATWGDASFNLSPGGEARRARGLFVSGDYFQVLGVPASLGRVFTADDDRRHCPDPGVIVSYGFWQRELGGSPAAIGRTLSVTGHELTVIGVTPQSFGGLEVGRGFDLILPLCADDLFYPDLKRLDSRYTWWLSTVGRLKPGWSVARAASHLQAVSRGIIDATIPQTYTPEDVEHYKQYSLTALPAGTGISRLRGEYSSALYFLLGIAGLVLLIACANLANLLLARASAREREISVRLALGASRGRLIRQLMTESLLIAVLGAALGLVMASMLGELLVALLSTPGRPLVISLTPDWRVLAFTMGLAGATCLLFGLAPALRASRTDVGLVLKATSGHGSTDRSRRFGLRRTLVSIQVALSFVLLFGAILFARSLRNLTTLDPGFSGEGVVVVDVNLRGAALAKDRLVPFETELLERVRAVPGVAVAATTTIVPISGSGDNDNVWLEGADKSKQFQTNFSRVSAGYFDTLRMQLLAGRDFSSADAAGMPRVAIVSQSFADRLAPGESPIGKRFRVEGGPDSPEEKLIEIIGVVRNSKYQNLRDPYDPIAYLPLAQDLEPRSDTTLILRSTLPQAQLVPGLKSAITGFEPRAVIEFSRLEEVVQTSLVQDRLMATLAGFFGILAGILASIGLYGVISYSVARRVHEIGIRMALGADAGRVARMIVSEAAKLVGVGLIIGIALAFAAAKLAGAMLYGLAPYDPMTFVAAIALMLVVAAISSALPARRASRVDPMVALRDE